MTHRLSYLVAREDIERVTSPNGTLRRLGIAIALNGSFTQEDVDLGRIDYLHDGSETMTS